VYLLAGPTGEGASDIGAAAIAAEIALLIWVSSSPFSNAGVCKIRLPELNLEREAAEAEPNEPIVPEGSFFRLLQVCLSVWFPGLAHRLHSLLVPSCWVVPPKGLLPEVDGSASFNNLSLPSALLLPRPQFIWLAAAPFFRRGAARNAVGYAALSAGGATGGFGPAK
jgi:hypothetical protein